MVSTYEAMLSEIEGLLVDGPDTSGTRKILRMLGGPEYAPEILEGIRLWNEYLPKSEELPYTQGQRYLHFLWDAFDKLPLCMSIPFAVPFRRLLAKKLFARCGKNFICEEGCRFNFGQNLEVGDDVIFNRGSYFDSKGGIVFGHFSAVAENVKIFSHSHGEADHTVRSYAKVTVGDYVKIYAGATVLPGVTLGAQSIVAANSLVSKDVAANMLVAGTPAREIRPRHNDGRQGTELNHYWLAKRAFQDE